MNSIGDLKLLGKSGDIKQALVSPAGDGEGASIGVADDPTCGKMGSSAHIRNTSFPSSWDAPSPFCNRNSRKERQSIALAAAAFLAVTFDP